MSRASTSTVMEMVRSREDLKEIESMTEWAGGDIFVLAAREGYAFDAQGICSQVGVAHAAGALLKYQGKGVRKQRTPRGPEPIREAQCADDEAHVPHEWILGSKANGVVRACRGWTQEQVDAVRAAIEAQETPAIRTPRNAEEGAELGEQMTAAEYATTATDVATPGLDEPARPYVPGQSPAPDLTEEQFASLTDEENSAWVSQRMVDEGLGTLLTDEERAMLADPHGCFICRDPKDHDGKPHGEVTGDGMTRERWRGQHEGKTFSAYGDICPDGWFPFGYHADRPEVHRLVFSDQCDDDGDPLWEKPFEGFGSAEGVHERPGVRSPVPNDEVDSTPGWHHNAAGAPVFDGQAAIDAGLLDDDEQPVVRQDIGHGLCPRCGSNDPKLHPATAFEGEVMVCPDGFHEPRGEGIDPTTPEKSLDEIFTGLTGLVVDVRNAATLDGQPFIPELQELIGWAARWEVELSTPAQAVRVLAEGLLPCVRELHQAIEVWSSTVKRQELEAEAERLRQALAQVQAQLMSLPAPAPELEDGNDRSQPTAEQHDAPVELHFPGPGERRGDPGVVPRPVLLGQARPVSVSPRRPYKPSLSQRLLDNLRQRKVDQAVVRAWCVEKGLNSGRGGLSVDAILAYMSEHQIAREV